MNKLSNERLKDIIESAVSQERISMARELLAYREAQGVAVSLPDHMPYLNEETLNNIINQDQEGSVANAARILAREVKFWHSKPLYAAPQLPVWFGVDWAAPAVADGWALVPIEPTEAMRDAWFFMEDFDSEWVAMLAAAPKPGVK